MPKLVDHAERRREIARVVWTIAAEDGLHAASLREVATRGGWSLGSLRHYVATRSELLELTLDELIASTGERIGAALERASGEQEALEIWLSELLPLDAGRTVELRTWLGYMVESERSPGAREMRARAYATLVDGVGQTLSELRPDWSPGLIRRRAERFVAIGDGLALQAFANPEAHGSARLRRHVRETAASTLAEDPSVASVVGGLDDPGDLDT